MLKGQNYYIILNVSPGADPGEIKKKFRMLAHQYHPDKTGGSPQSETLFKIINEAYRVLSDPNARVRYDSYLKTSPNLKKASPASQKSTKTGQGALPLELNSVESVLSQLNILLWDIEDFLRDTDANQFNWFYSQQPTWYFITRLLTYIEMWLFDPRAPERNVNRSKVGISSYFYRLRLKVDKLFGRLNWGDLMEPLPGYGITRMDAILEVQRHTIHYLSVLKEALSGKIEEIPPYTYRKPFYSI